MLISKIATRPEFPLSCVPHLIRATWNVKLGSRSYVLVIAQTHSQCRTRPATSGMWSALRHSWIPRTSQAEDVSIAVTVESLRAQTNNVTDVAGRYCNSPDLFPGIGLVCCLPCPATDFLYSENFRKAETRDRSSDDPKPVCVEFIQQERHGKSIACCSVRRLSYYIWLLTVNRHRAVPTMARDHEYEL